MKPHFFLIIFFYNSLIFSINFTEKQLEITPSNEECAKTISNYFKRHKKKRPSLVKQQILECIVQIPNSLNNLEIYTLKRKFIEQTLQIHLKSKIPSTKEIKQLHWLLKNFPTNEIESFEFYIVTLLYHPLETIRKETARLLVHANIDPLIPTLIQMSRSPNPLERIYMLESLELLQNTKLLSALILLLQDPNQMVRISAMRTLSKTPEVASNSSYYKIGLQDKSSKVQVNTLKLIRKENISFINLICKMVYSPNSSVQEAALNIILYYDAEQCLPYITFQLTKENNPDMQKMLLQKHIEFKKNRNINLQGLKYILTQYQSVPKENLLIAIYAAGLIKKRALISFLKKLLDFPDDEINVETVYALSKFKRKNIMFLLSNLLNSIDTSIWVQSAILDTMLDAPTYTTLLNILTFYQKTTYLPLKYQAQQTLKQLLNVRF